MGVAACAISNREPKLMPWQTRDAQGSMQSAHDVLEILSRVNELDEALHVVTQLLQEIMNVLERGVGL